MDKINNHIKSFKQSWSYILSQPIEHLINILVLGLIITICGIGLSLNNNMDTWKANNIVYPQMIVYMNTQANQADIDATQKAINKAGAKIVKSSQFISKDQALAELSQDKNMKEISSDVISSSDNPLPDVIIINTSTSESSILNKLDMQISQIAMVDDVQVDMNYAGKVDNLILFASRLSFAIQILFIAVLGLVIYNMIRLQMMLKSDAIQVSRLIGASDSFIMRPLIHYALWQVTIATLAAYAGLFFISNSLNNLFASFSNLFGNGFKITLLPIEQFAMMWASIAIFTIFTVFLAVRWVFNNTQAKQ
ncbi:MAG: permease-like cell division protein FtsX [Burkholderiales bacterium]|nr:permease-like cell division protein FtsX [Burkholderiales bacterium]